MKYEIVTKRKTWREIHIAADQIKPLKRELTEVFNTCAGVAAVFDGEVTKACDEFVSIRNGKFYHSSNHRGIIEWSRRKKQYLHYYWGTTTPLGQLVRIEIQHSKETLKLLNP